MTIAEKRSHALQNHFSGPYCPACGDAPPNLIDPCRCDEARCVMPKCRTIVSRTALERPPVPVSMLLWRVSGDLKKHAEISPGWACRATCLLGFVRQRQPGSAPEQARRALYVLNSLQAPYMGVSRVKDGEPELDREIWRILARDQLQTIHLAAQYASLASVP